MDINEVGAETPNHAEETDKSVEELQIERSENRFVAATLDLLEQSIDQVSRLRFLRVSFIIITWNLIIFAQYILSTYFNSS